MKITTTADNPYRARMDLLACFVFEEKGRIAWEGSVPEAIARALREPLGDFSGKANQVALVHIQVGSTRRRMLLVGLGKRKEFTPEVFRTAVGALGRKARDLSLRSVGALCPPGRDLARLGRSFAEGLELGLYRFDRFKSKKKGKKGADLRTATLFLPARKGAREVSQAARLGQVLGKSTNLTRDLGNTPSNHAPPSHLARKAREIARSRKLSCQVLQEAEMRRLGMGALLGVAQGSQEPPRFIILEHRGPKKATETIVLVGKGVTFDSGGISLKPSLKMEDMKFDMCGAATVLGALDAVAQLGLKCRVIGLVPAVENLPSGTAQKPGDVVRSLSGKTVEVINTDAEGRLILADALTYAKRYKPDAVIDLATLTGACIIALGHHAGGLMGSDDRLLKGLLKAGERSGERVWSLPIWPEYRKQIDSTVADVKNTGGRPAGTITAALFLKEFVGDFPWAHLDIAGVAWTESATPIQEKGATGFGVRLLVDYLLERQSR